MANKTANLYARIEPDIQEQAEAILSELGIAASNAINMFYKQIILQRGLPFDVKLPSKHVVDISTLSDEEMDREIEKGYTDILDGKVKPTSGMQEEIQTYRWENIREYDYHRF